VFYLWNAESYASLYNLDENSFQNNKSLIIEGSVVDEEGIPLAGASVLIKGTTIGVSADENGKFVIRTKPRTSIILVIQTLGMETKEIKYKEGEKVNVVLKQSLEGIVELVVTGYQTMDRRLSSSSIYKISGADVIQSNAVSLDNMLQGKIPGLQVVNATSTAGASTKIRIRGTSTISGNREPLWVVDGIILDDPVQIPTEELNNLDNVNLIGSAIEGLNPMDIESIDILKDASATAIYGVKAANGVIVVTTKKGKKVKLV
jgi:TonB-dependent outer membrane receptor, SusC/RagA subfamily, signature region